MERNFRSTSQIWNFFWRDKEGSGMPDPQGKLRRGRARPTLIAVSHASPAILLQQAFCFSDNVIHGEAKQFEQLLSGR
ncbi:hypothetical protein ABMA09_04570 [Erwinia rhapontici]